MEFWISSPLCFGNVVRSTDSSPTIARAETDTPAEIAAEIRLVYYLKVYSSVSTANASGVPYGECGSWHAQHEEFA